MQPHQIQKNQKMDGATSEHKSQADGKMTEEIEKAKRKAQGTRR